MATINIANLTFSHKGNYDGSTAYVKNDVVYYATNGNAYIAKQGTTGNVPTNGTYWSQFAAGSGGIWNAGLSLGSANQVVRVNSGGNALEFGSVDAGSHTKIAQFTSSGTPTEFVLDNIFTSTYDFYMIYVTNYLNVTNNLQWYMKLRTGGSSGSTDTGSNYRGMVYYTRRDSGSETSAADGFWDNNHYRITNFDLSADTNSGSFVKLYIANPYNNDRKTSFYHEGFINNGDANSVAYTNGSCFFNANTSHTGICFTAQDSSNKVANGNKAFVYGIKY